MGQIFDTDVFVVGGGPAGLGCAIAARQHGLRVIVADSAQPPIDKACGEGLMPDSLEVLAQPGRVAGRMRNGCLSGNQVCWAGKFSCGGIPSRLGTGYPARAVASVVGGASARVRR